MLREYSRLRKVYLRSHRICRACYQKPATEIHHTRGRAGEMLIRVEYWMPVCFDCHRFITDNPEEARKEGWICEKGKWLEP